MVVYRERNIATKHVMRLCLTLAYLVPGRWLIPGLRLPPHVAILSSTHTTVVVESSVAHGGLGPKPSRQLGQGTGGQLHVICRWRELRVACVYMSPATLLVSYLASSVGSRRMVRMTCSTTTP